MRRGSVVNRLLDRYLGIPVLFSASLFRRRRKIPSDIRTIGLMGNPTLGDSLLSSGAVLDVRKHFPKATLIYIGSKTNAAAVKLLPATDKIIFISMTHPLKSLRKLRDCKLDILIDLTTWQRITAFYTAFSGARYRIGFRTKNQYRHWHYDLTAEHSAKVHEVNNYRNLLRALGLDPQAAPALNIPPNATFERDDTERYIVFHPWASGDRRALREWPVDQWVQLAKKLNRPRTHFLITGAPSQLPESTMLCARLKSAGVQARPFTGNDGLNSVAALLKSADLVVSVNTGIMHLAAILGAPTVALNGPNSEHRWGPVGPRVANVSPHGGGGGFLHLGFEFSGNPTDTMERTRVEDVLAAAAKLLAATQSEQRIAAEVDAVTLSR